MIKPGIVHIHNGIVYKNSPNSKEIVTKIDECKAHPVFKHFSIPLAYLYIKDFYFGYTYKFKTDLHLVDDAETLGIIKNKEDFIKELFLIIEQLNSINLCYWDFHKYNIYSDNSGNPFFIDYDDIQYNPSSLNMYHQSKYLTEYILQLLLNQEKTLIQFLKDSTLMEYLSNNSKEYLESLKCRTDKQIELPYTILEDLSDKSRRELIKSKIK
jgi:hypothetical protein